MTLEATVSVGVKGNNSGVVDLGVRSRQIALAANLAFTDGSGAGQASKSFTDSASQAQSVNTDLDLAGALTGDDGATVTFTAIKAIVISAGAANPGNLSVGPAPANGVSGIFSGTTPAIVLKPGARFVLAVGDAAGYAITAATADLLRIASAATSGTYTYDICILGI
jgi:hypothetical protein